MEMRSYRQLVIYLKTLFYKFKFHLFHDINFLRSYRELIIFFLVYSGSILTFLATNDFIDRSCTQIILWCHKLDVYLYFILDIFKNKKSKKTK